MAVVRVCFVCLGNICRSPTAEGVMLGLVREAGLEDRIEIDSAGTSGYHSGELPDSRSRAAARRRGFELRGKSRQFARSDWERFDYVLALDSSNFEDLSDSAPSPAARQKLAMLRSFDPASPNGAGVPDPYYGGEDGFDDVIDICQAACTGLLAKIRSDHGL
jgi:protein-tyrosine phosphatase